MNRKAITRMQTILLIGVVAVAAAVGGGLYYFVGQEPVSTDAIKFGHAVPLTGAQAEQGKYHLEGVAIALDEINAAGGVLGRNISVIWADDESKIETGVSVTERLISMDKVDVLTGGFASSISLAEMDVVANYKIPWIISGSVSSSIATKIASVPKYQYIFKLSGNSTGWGLAYSDFISYITANGTYTPRTKTYAVIIEDTDWGRSNLALVNSTLAAIGWQNVDVEAVQLAQADYYSILTKIQALNPDVLISFQTSLPAAVALGKQYRELSLKILYLPAELPGRADYKTVAGNDTVEQLPWVMFPAINPSRSEAASFISKYQARWGRSPVASACVAYTVMYVMANAIKKAGSLDPDAIKAALLQTDFNGPIGRYVFYQTTHEGITGLGYQSGGTYQIFGGTNYYVFPLDRAERQFVIPDWMKP
jgi:branched-chain amino acid transport system substrate-binding protein